MLEVKELRVARGGVPVLSDVSFSVAPGEALILRGPNGIGKTTLLRTVAGLQPPVAGQIAGGEEVAYAGHADGIKLTLTVAENLRFWADVFGQADIEAAMTGFDLAGLRNRPAGEMSAGQKRRLSLARLVVSKRPIWVLDEPTVSLDRVSVGLFASAVSTHLRGGGAALLATHIDLGLEGRVLDLTPFKARLPELNEMDEGFL